jgi:hypothetical protein
VPDAGEPTAPGMSTMAPMAPTASAPPNTPEVRAVPGAEFNCTDPAALGPSMARRLSVPEYVNTVRDVVGIDTTSQAQQLLPKDVRADGFENGAANLVVALDHIQGFAKLAEFVGEELLKQPAFLDRHTACAEMTEACATAFIDNAGSRILRAPVLADERTALLGVFQEALSSGLGFGELRAWLVQAMLQSPRFLYRTETQIGTEPVRSLDDYEIANRLSYLAWGSAPDEQLLSAAAGGGLSSGSALPDEITRVLTDVRSKEQMLLFADQFLHLGRLVGLQRDPVLFPAWDPALGTMMLGEARAAWAHVWDSGRPATDLYSLERAEVALPLAAHYGFAEPAMPGVYDLSSQPERVGLLTQGAVLAVGGNTASMVSRGLFLLEHFLCGHVESPPAGVDTVPPEVAPGASNRTHSEGRTNNPACAGCHRQFEPAAWGLERFDSTGVYREQDALGNALLQDGNVAVPGTAELLSFSSIAEMANVFAQEPRVRDCLLLKTAQFALGRRLVAQDACTLAAARDTLAQKPGTLAEIVVALANTPMLTSVTVDPPESQP